MTTRNVESRIVELCQTGVPGKFKEFSSAFSPDCRELESWVHDDLAEFRVDAGREFFGCSPHDADRVLLRRVEEQVSLLVDEFLDGHMLVEETHFVDPCTVDVIGSVLGVPSYDVPNILDEVRSTDVSIDMNVLKARWEARRAKRIADIQARNGRDGLEVVQ
jgi:hypothetical protein